MQPALFELAVRWSERLSEAASAAIATRVAGGDATYGADDIQSETLRIPQDMGNVQHVSRDGVAFSLRMLADLRQSLAMRGLGAGLPDGANALFGDFPGLHRAGCGRRQRAFGRSSAGRRAHRGACRPAARRRARRGGCGRCGGPWRARRAGCAGVGRRCAFLLPNGLPAAGERGSVRDLVRMQQQREAVRVKVKQVTL